MNQVDNTISTLKISWLKHTFNNVNALLLKRCFFLAFTIKDGKGGSDGMQKMTEGKYSREKEKAFHPHELLTTQDKNSNHTNHIQRR